MGEIKKSRLESRNSREEDFVQTLLQGEKKQTKNLKIFRALEAYHEIEGVMKRNDEILSKTMQLLKERDAEMKLAEKDKEIMQLKNQLRERELREEVSYLRGELQRRDESDRKRIILNYALKHADDEEG